MEFYEKILKNVSIGDKVNAGFYGNETSVIIKGFYIASQVFQSKSLDFVSKCLKAKLEKNDNLHIMGIITENGKKWHFDKVQLNEA